MFVGIASREPCILFTTFPIAGYCSRTTLCCLTCSLSFVIYDLALLGSHYLGKCSKRYTCKCACSTSRNYAATPAFEEGLTCWVNAFHGEVGAETALCLHAAGYHSKSLSSLLSPLMSFPNKLKNSKRVILPSLIVCKSSRGWTTQTLWEGFSFPEWKTYHAMQTHESSRVVMNSLNTHASGWPAMRHGVATSGGCKGIRFRVTSDEAQTGYSQWMRRNSLQAANASCVTPSGK